MKTSKLAAALLFLSPSTLTPALAVAAPGGGPPTPPAEAYTACAGSAASDACAVQLPDRTVAGICTADAQDALFCRPARPPHRAPPPEAYAACHERTQAAACTVKLGGGETVDGQCVADPGGEAQFCRPDHMPAPPGE